MNERDFEQWYVENAFDYAANPIGSRDCGLQRKAWLAALSAAKQGVVVDGVEMRLYAVMTFGEVCDPTRWNPSNQPLGAASAKDTTS